MTTTFETMETLFSNHCNIPTLPSTMVNLVSSIADASCNAERLTKIVTSDPAIAATVLKLANSAYYGFPKKIMSIQQAISLLGYSTLQDALLSASALEFHQLDKIDLDMSALWQHSVATGNAARLIAKRVRFPQVEKAYTAGLLHDIGKIVLAGALPEKLNDITKMVDRQNCSMIQAEELVLGCCHPEIGGMILDKWELPAAVTEAVAFHHHPTHAPTHSHLASIVYLANILAHRSGLGSGGDDMVRELDPAVKRQFRLKEHDLAELQIDLSFKPTQIEELNTVVSGEKAES